jgi:hypothetical protein
MRHRSPGRDHGILATAIEELFIALGIADWARTCVWEPMKQAIDNAFANDPQAGGTAFLKKLKKIWTKQPNLRVTLIAHSAGSIFVQRFIEAMDASFGPQPQQVEVITMAAAVSFERMMKGLAALQRRVSAVRVFGLHDALEAGYWEVPFIYPRSLLYIVCSLCEDDPEADKPLFGMERYWRGPPYDLSYIKAITQFIDPPKKKERSVWSLTRPTARPGYRSSATRHGRGVPPHFPR